MMDYAFQFSNEAAAKSALAGFWFDIGGGEWVWNTSLVLAGSSCGNATPLKSYMGTDAWDGYSVVISQALINESLWALPECVVEGDRDSSSIRRTRLDDAQAQAYNTSPIMSGTAYLFPGRGVTFILDDTQHPIPDDANTDIQGPV